MVAVVCRVQAAVEMVALAIAVASVMALVAALAVMDVQAVVPVEVCLLSIDERQ